MVAASRRNCCYERKIVEVDGAVRFRPEAHLARLRESLVIHIEDLVAVEVNREKRTVERDPQGAPNSGGYMVGDSIGVGRFIYVRVGNALAFLEFLYHELGVA